MSIQEEPLSLQRWRRDGIRYLGKFGTGFVDAMDRWRHGFDKGYEAGVLAAARDFELPEGCHVAAFSWSQEEEERE